MSEPTCVVCGRPWDGRGLQCPGCRGGEIAAPPEPRRAAFPGRVAVTLPWTALASDNLRKGVATAQDRGKTKRYAAALARFREKLAEQYDGEPFGGPARLSATLYVPDNVRRDATFNFVKLIADGCKGLLVEDDAWAVVPEATFRVAGVDRDRPRVEIVVDHVA